MPPRKRKAPKKPILEEEDLSETEKEDQPKKDQLKEEPSDSITEGANDLMHLPIEVIQEELIRRGYYPKMIKHFNQNILVSILREETSQIRETKRNRGTLVSKKGANMRNAHKNKPIFNQNSDSDDNPNQAEEDDNDDDNKSSESSHLPEVKPTEFK